MALAGGVKALIIAPAWVGDMVMAHSLLQLLVAQHNNIQLHVLAPPATAALATRMAQVHEVHTLEVGHGEWRLGRRRQAAQRLNQIGFDCAYVLPNSWKSALIPYLARIPQRIGWRGEARFGLLNRQRPLDKDAYPLMIERFMALASDTWQLPAQPYPLPRLVVDDENLQRCLQAFALQPDSVAILCPGAEFGEAKKWPAEHYAEVARHLLANGRQVWLLGSPKDVDDCAAIAQLAPGVENLAGHTSLVDAIDLLSVAEQVVCNDSGLMHVACALGKPTIGIFGSTSPEFTPPLGQQAQVVELEMDCRPCFQRICPLGHLNCLRQLSPQQVIERMVVL
jgi:lipopolysaccharide heptosyltransferase II